MKLSIGPLRYRLLAHDAWGREMLASIRGQVKTIGFTDATDRTIHLRRYDLKKEDFRPSGARGLPSVLAELVPDKMPRLGWVVFHDNRGYCYWHHVRSRLSFWTMDPVFRNGPKFFQIPWPFLFEDIIGRGGGLMHAGLAEKNGRGMIFTASSGGGKTTALSRLPRPWRVHADDAVLIWPQAPNCIAATPLPTWGGLVGTSRPCPTLRGKWDNALVIPVTDAAFLIKSGQVRFLPVRPAAAVPPLFKALVEHPMAVRVYKSRARELFRFSARLARRVRLWNLETTKEGSYWTEIEGKV